MKQNRHLQVQQILAGEVKMETQTMFHANGDINNVLWFERDTIAQHLGYSDWDEYEYGDKEEEDEEE